MQLALGVVGAAVGGFFGGPAGAQAGFIVGSLIGGLLDPPKSPAIPDLKVQSSAYGKFIPTVYGRYRVAGNVIWTSPVWEVTENKKKAPVQAAHLAMAVALCNGPIVSVRRIWANNKLVYDVSNPSNFAALSGGAQSLSNWTLYPGDENQNADPTMESYLGAANVPAYRGLAYVVFNNLDLVQFGNVIPQFEFEVITFPTASWTASILDTWNAPPASLGVLTQAPRPTAQGAVAMSYGYYLGYNGTYVGQLSAYSPGVTTSVLHPNPRPADTNNYLGNSDQDGIYATGYWYDPMGGVTPLPGATGPNIFGLGQNTFWRNGLDFYCTSAFGGGANYYVSRVDMLSGQLIAQGTRLGSWVILGGSASYVYAVNVTSGGATLYQFNRVTMAETGVTWTLGSLFATAQNGYVVDDDTIYIVLGAVMYLFKPSQNTATQLAQCPFGTQPPNSIAVLSNSLIVMTRCGANYVQFGYMSSTAADSNVTLASIVGDVCSRAGLSSGQYDTSPLTDLVKGYAVSSYSTGRNALDPLMSLYFFDAVDSEGKIKFVKRGSSSVVSVPFADIGVKSSAGASDTDPIQETIVSELEMPRSVLLTYKGAYNDYASASQRALRMATASNQDVSAMVSVVLADDEAATRAQTYLWAAWTSRYQLVFGTSISYLQYEPSDVVTLNDQDGTQYLVRLTKCSYDGKGGLSWEAVIENPSLYPNFTQFIAAGGQSLGFTPQLIDYNGPSALVIMDGPPVRAGDSSYGVYVAACGYASTWPGIAIEVSRDGSAYTTLANDTNAATIGSANTALPNFGGGNMADELSAVSITLFNGTLTSASYSDFLNNLNLAWLGGEIISFRTATQTGTDTYTLSGLLRGRFGTEAAMANHAVGEQFVLLDFTKVFVENLTNTDVGRKLYWEYQLLNQFGATANPIVTATPTNAHVQPLAVAMLAAGHGSAASASDITLNWFRRARINASWQNGTDVPLDESTESYQVQVFNGSSLVRTTTVTGPFTATSAQPSQYQGNPTWTYTAAQITADGFSAGNTITFTVQQNSDQGVLGASASTTITR